MNITLAGTILQALADKGVENILICAGARNSPLVMQLNQCKGFQLWNFYDERSAGFFALGRSQRDQRPVAVITTSGTAVAELLASAVEATYTQTPLIFITADRPRSYRGTGAPQSIDQVGLFFKYVETCVDIAVSKEAPKESLDLSMWSGQAPLQINICFEEPLIDERVPDLDFTNKIKKELPPPVRFNPRQLKTLNQPLVIVGPLSIAEAQYVAPILEKLGAPIYAEALSNLHVFTSLGPLLIQSGEKLVSTSFRKAWSQSILRVGGVPTLRFWRDLEESFSSLPVLSIANSEWKGLSRPSLHFVGLENLLLVKAEWQVDSRKEIFREDQEKKLAIQNLIEKYSQSEQALTYELTKSICEKKSEQFLYVGNSLPIRHLDLNQSLLGPRPNLLRKAGNRGANGIDGQISSFFGGSDQRAENWCIVGDLTALYDLGSPWVCQQMDAEKLRLVIINNQGGMIFKSMFQKEIFLNRHSVDFSKWAGMWHWPYQKWTQIPLPDDLPDQVVIEIHPNSEQSDHFSLEYSRL